ncbi:hypothetical protein BGM25_19250 [Bacillus sp. FJAT-29953]|nr:hypothetical protein [Bacillus sp. FJAT-29953]
MKRILYSFLLIILAVGVSGCMKQESTDKEAKTSEQAMLKYLKDTYGQGFTKIEYIPAKRGFNDSLNKNILIAKSEDGVLVNVQETLSSKGEFYDNYPNAYAGKLFDAKIDYTSIKNLRAAKTYANLNNEDLTIEDMQQKEFTFAKGDVYSLDSIISISGEADDEVLKELYQVYQTLQTFDSENISFIVAFSGDGDKAKKYVENFYLYGVQDWEEFDKSVKEMLTVLDKGLSFEEFKSQLKTVGG